MRISDWSSDVCSSDLYYALGVVVTNGWVAQTPSFGGYSATVAYLPERRLGVAVTTTMGRDPAELGRESCRDRVCQYVSISVVAVSSKNKHIISNPITQTANIDITTYLL